MPRILALSASACLAALLVCGCQPSQTNIENSIREEMKTSLGVEIKLFDLKKQPDGGFAGTATAANGDVYEVTAAPPKGGTTEWKAVPGQAMVERIVRQGMEEQLKAKVKTLNLTRQSAGAYTGTAELDNGNKMNVSTSMDGKNLSWKADPAN